MNAATLQKLEAVRERLEGDLEESEGLNIDSIGRAADLTNHAAAQIKKAAQTLAAGGTSRESDVRDHWHALLKAQKSMEVAAKGLRKAHHSHFYGGK